MKIIKENHFSSVFPMRIKCKRVVDRYGFDYGKKNDFCGSELEIEASDIQKKEWFKYPDYSGVDYGVTCPICGQFIVIDGFVIPQSVLQNVKCHS